MSTEAERLETGVQLLADGDYTAAIELFESLRAQDSERLEVLHPLAIAYIHNNNSDKAESLLRMLVERSPGDTDCFLNLVRLLRQQDRTAEARHLLEARLASPPVSGKVATYRIDWLMQENGLDDALNLALSCLQQNPSSILLLLKVTELYVELQDYDSAEQAVRKAQVYKPESPQVRLSLALLLRLRARYSEAEDLLQVLRSQYPRRAEVHEALGLVHMARSEFTRALACLHIALRLKPDYQSVHANLGLARLSVGQVATGWAEYEYRSSRLQALEPWQNLPEWQGPADSAASLLVVAEQGIGDEVMFASVFKLLLQELEQVSVLCDARLEAVLKRSFPGISVISQAHEVDAGQYDAVISMASLMQYYRNSRASFEESSPYLLADPKLVAKWQHRLADLGTGLKIGISWWGGKNEETRCARSIDLSEWSPLLSLPGIEFINLQYGESATEAIELAEQTGFSLHTFSDIDPLTDLEGLFALMVSLDWVITVDNSTVHFAGALGCRTALLLPQYCDWRWMGEVQHPLWYPSVSLYRQKRQNDWKDVMNKLAMLFGANGRPGAALPASNRNMPGRHHDV